jgi:chemotaxis protein CheX
MNVQALVVSSIRNSVVQVFATMLSSEIETGELLVEHSGPETSDGVVSFIGMAGRWTGTGSLTCSASTACRISSQMLMTEVGAIDEEVLDVVAELTNMIIGNVKSELERFIGELGLSLPTVVFGRNFRSKTAGTAEWIVQKFHWEGEELQVKMCLTPVEKASQKSHVSSARNFPVEV